MRQSIGNIWITGLVITFMLIFVGYLTFMLSFSDTEKTKNDILSIIEKRNGITNIAPKSLIGKANVGEGGGSREMLIDFGTLQTINLYLKGRQYKQKGICSNHPGETWYGVSSLDLDKNNYGVKIEEVKDKSTKSYYYCFSKKLVDDGRTGSRKTRTSYYRILVFYYFDLPIIPVLKMPVEGRTAVITVPSYCEIKQYRNAFPNINYSKMCPLWNEGRRVVDK